MGLLSYLDNVVFVAQIARGALGAAQTLIDVLCQFGSNPQGVWVPQLHFRYFKSWALLLTWPPRLTLSWPQPCSTSWMLPQVWQQAP